jgi:TRAP-type C4-dicarboxylate transport system substrate-binding protein
MEGIGGGSDFGEEDSSWGLSNRVNRCSLTASTLYSSGFARLASGSFYEIIKNIKWGKLPMSNVIRTKSMKARRPIYHKRGEMMKITRTVCFWGILSLWALGLGFAGMIPLAGAAPPGTNPEFILRCAGTMPIDHFMTKTLDYYAQLMAEKSKGRVKIEVYPSNQLFSDKDLPKALPSGAADMAQVNMAMWAGLIPPLAVFDIPFFFRDRDHFNRSLDAGNIKILLDGEFENRGVKILFWMDYGFMTLIGKRPVKTLEDFKGKRIRGYGEISTEMIQNLGGAPVFLSVGEVYMALQRGTMDGVLTSLGTAYERKFYEVVKNCMLFRNGELNVPPPVLINLKKFRTLPFDLQKILTDAGKEAQSWAFAHCQKGMDEFTAGMKEKGMNIYYLPDKERKRWAEANQNILTRYIERTGKVGKELVEEIGKVR